MGSRSEQLRAEDRLRDRFSEASETVPGHPLDWGATYARARRSRTVYLSTVAFGTAVVLAAGVFGAWAVVDERGGGPVPFGPTSPEAPSPSSSPSPSDGPGPEETVSFEEPFRAVETFIQGAANGDASAIWAGLTDFSKAVYDHDFDRFRTNEFSGIQEGWGSWAAADDFGMHWQPIASSGDGVMGVVTLMGSRAPEGHEEPYASAALPVRIDSAGDAKVEPFVSRGLFEYHVPRNLPVEQPPELDVLSARNISFDVFVPGNPTEVDMVAAPVPDEPAVTVFGRANIEDGDDDHVRAVWAPEERLFAGEWFLTVVGVSADGSMQADSVRFTIE